MRLEYIAGYLPYKLKGQFQVKDVVKSAPEEIREKMLRKDNVNFFFTFCKPILRPLDLTKEIDINGDKFVPIERLNNINPEYPLLISEGSIFFTDACNLNMLEITQIYEIFQKLFEWHFDLFGLIEKGLAIDINTLKN